MEIWAKLVEIWAKLKGRSCLYDSCTQVLLSYYEGRGLSDRWRNRENKDGHWRVDRLLSKTHLKEKEEKKHCYGIYGKTWTSGRGVTFQNKITQGYNIIRKLCKMYFHSLLF